MIKVCGLRRKEDIEYANELKPHYIGFIFAESKRQVTKREAIELKRILDKDIKTVGIFVNEDIDYIMDIANSVHLDVIQLHGDEDNIYINKLRENIKQNETKKEIWKAIRVKNSKSLKQIDVLDIEGVLLDTYSKEAYGGLGETFNWEHVSDLKLDKKLILAGGLDSENVKDAKQIVNPDIIDVSSGVETKGFKDYQKMKIFIEKGR